MKKFFTVLLIIFVIALAMTITGGVLIWKNPDKYPIFAKETFVEKTITEESEVTSFYLSIASDDVDIFPSEDGKLSITYYESETFTYNYEFEDGKATFSDNYTFNIKNIFKFRFFDDKPNMKIYLPETVNTDLSLKLSSGEISFKNSNFTLENFYVSIASGEVELSNINADLFRINISSGDITLSDINSEDAKIIVSSGKISIDNSALTSLDINISSGNFVSHNLATDKVDCIISSGTVRLGLSGNSSEYTIRGETSTGNITLDFGGIKSTMGNNVLYGNGPKSITAKISSGNLIITAD